MKPVDFPETVLMERPASPAPAPGWRQRLWTMMTPRGLALALVGLPMLLGALYFTVLAQERYLSTAIVTVRRTAHDTAVGNGLAVLLTGAGAGAAEDVRYLRDYLHSLALMRKLDAELGLRRHFENAPRDPFYRLWPQTSQEWMLDYWRSRVGVELDEMSGLLTVRVEGFGAEFAQRVNQALLRESEAFVNDISQRIAREQMAFAQSELERAAGVVQAARGTLLQFQTRNQVLDPIGQAQATGLLTAELRAQLAKVEAELNTKRAYLNEDAPDVVSLKAQAAALRLQAERESRGATQPAQGSLNRLAVEFHELKARAGFAEDAYKVALATVENARLEASRKVRSLVVIEPPTRAETAEYPRRVYNLLTLLMASLLVYATVRLAVATVNEHRD